MVTIVDLFTILVTKSHDPPSRKMQVAVLLMDKILHDPKDPKLWELWYIPYSG